MGGRNNLTRKPCSVDGGEAVAGEGLIRAVRPAQEAQEGVRRHRCCRRQGEPWAAPAKRGESRGASIKTPAANSKACRAWVSITMSGAVVRSPGGRCRKIRVTGSGTRWIKAARQNRAASANCWRRALRCAAISRRWRPNSAQRSSVWGDRGPREEPCPERSRYLYKYSLPLIFFQCMPPLRGRPACTASR